MPRQKTLKLRKETNIATTQNEHLARTIDTGLCNAMAIHPSNYTVHAVWNADTKQDTWVIRIYGPCSETLKQRIQTFCLGIAYAQQAFYSLYLDR